ncbi:cytochrome P450 [Calocera viscosa TUFC12733]|uniref:Cytochrome P450 n=1 Tax=Calocera viscosa (strain TUFC12733) TaxID=1330018 RepID=A0A167P053_CALVF|nr:cytochrome P450 [Calocera viscosa TUFC12733]
MLAVIFVGFALHRIWEFCKRFRTPLKRFDGPEADSWLWGNSLKIIGPQSSEDEWIQAYGRTYVTPVMFGKLRLNTTDPRAVAHVLAHVDNWPKPEPVRELLGSVTGEGLFIAEGETHKRQRRIMNPSFSSGQLRELNSIFFETANQLRDVLDSILTGGRAEQEIDMFNFAGRASLDIIGLAGFGYRFNALDDERNELFTALNELVQAMSRAPLMSLLRNRMKWLRYIPTKTHRVMKASLESVNRIGMELVLARKEEVQQDIQGATVSRSKIVGKDLLSSLVRANMAQNLPISHRLSDKEVLAQISTFVVAGHETSAVSLSWTLLALAEHQEVQHQLRNELSLVAEEAPSMDELNALPYLDMVVKESLRFRPPVPLTTRIAVHDDEIPLSRPVADRYGVPHDSIQVQAGDFFGIEIRAMNRSKELWGEDADDFRPERWNEELAGARAIPGPYAHILTFLGGPRACIGYKFSIMELKSLLFTLIRSFEFAPVPGKKIGTQWVIVDRPIVKGEERKGLQLPLIVKRTSKEI